VIERLLTAHASTTARDWCDNTPFALSCLSQKPAAIALLQTHTPTALVTAALSLLSTPSQITAKKAADNSACSARAAQDREQQKLRFENKLKNAWPVSLCCHALPLWHSVFFCFCYFFSLFVVLQADASQPHVLFVPSMGVTQPHTQNWYGAVALALVTPPVIRGGVTLQPMPEPMRCREKLWVQWIHQHMLHTVSTSSASAAATTSFPRVILVGHSTGADAVLRALELYSVFGAVVRHTPFPCPLPLMCCCVLNIYVSCLSRL
jgi:hypothetical protein